MLETDLHEPVRNYLEQNGFEVRSEVHKCDMAAVKDSTLVVVEMKLKLNAELLCQAVDRQKLTDYVYIAIPTPEKKGRKKSSYDMENLAKRLELGLFHVDIKTKKVTCVFEPIAYDRAIYLAQAKSRTKKFFKEFNSRSVDLNKAGSVRSKLITAYKEKSLYIACCLHTAGAANIKDIIKMGSDQYKTKDILEHNYSNWFFKIKGSDLYGLSAEGETAIKEYSVLSIKQKKEIQKNMEKPVITEEMKKLLKIKE